MFYSLCFEVAKINDSIGDRMLACIFRIYSVVKIVWCEILVCSAFSFTIPVLLLLLLFVITFIRGIYNYVHETKRVSGVYV